MNDEWDRLTVNIEPPLAELAKARAKKLRQSFSAYVATLVERDVRENMAAEETEAPYGKTTKKVSAAVAAKSGGVAGAPSGPAQGHNVDPKQHRSGAAKRET